MWAMKIEYYFSHAEYPIWQVIKPRNGPLSVTTDTNGTIKVLPPKTTEEVVARERERKARTTLLMDLPEDNLAKFYKMVDGKEMWEAIKSRFCGNDESKKIKKYLLKQQFKGFYVSTSEGLNKGYDRFQTLLSQLEIHATCVSHEDANQKFQSFDDLYNNITVFERNVKGTTASSSNIYNVAFVSPNNTSSTNDVAMISMRIKKIYKRTGRNLQFDTKDLVGFDKTKVECFNCHKMRHFARDCRAKGNQNSIRRDVRYNGNKTRDNGRRPAYQDDSKALVTIDGEDLDWSGPVEEDAQNYAMMAYSSSNSGYENKTLVYESDFKPSEYASCESDFSVETTTSMPEPVENAPKDKEKPSFAFTDYVKPVKTSRENIKESGTPNHSPKIRKQGRDGHTRKGLDYAFTRKACFVCDDPHRVLEDKGIVNTGCSRYMTGNKAHLADYQEVKGGSVAFGGSNGRITDKGKIKNMVLFTNTDYHVLSPDFKLPDENLVLLKIPRQHNMYSLNLKNINPLRDLACLFAKASIDESNKWHRRLGHVNFKNINKLMMGNLVRGLPSKIFINDHTCIACQKGKQHKASWIKREYSNARTPQQNKVAKRKNMILIEAARTMVLVTMPQNKTPYELLTVENQANKSAGPKEAKNSVEDKIEKNIDFKTCEKPVSQVEKIFLEELEKLKRQENEANDAARKETTHENTNLLNTVSTPLSAAGPLRSLNVGELSYPDDSSMPHLEDIYAIPSEGIFTVSSWDNEGVIAFLYGTIDEEVYVTQPPGFVDHKFHNKTASTPIETQKPLVKDEDATDVDVHLYRSMIGSLMYLTASRPDIMFAVYACSRFQATLKTSHLQAVKRIFRYLKGQPKLGLVYPKVSSFDLESDSDSDYTGANLDRKSITGGCQFLGKRLIL
nr:ribonuclease H-like domain-containing protein [Tanacetum cinerariifolium]